MKWDFQYYKVVTILLFLFIKINVFAQDIGERPLFTSEGWAGARYIAMGKAVEAVVDDVYAIYWNPGGIIELKGGSGILSQGGKERSKSADIEDITEEDLIRFSDEQEGRGFAQVGVSAAMLDTHRKAGFCGVAFNVLDGVAGIGLYSIESKDVKGMNEYGNFIENLDYSSYVSYLTYGLAVGVASFGISVKGLYEVIGSCRYYGGGIDIGTQVELFPFFRIGLVLQDIGTGLKPVRDYEDVDGGYDFVYPVLRFSAAFTSIASDIVIAASSVKKIEQEKFDFNVGLQYNVHKNFTLYIGSNDLSFSFGFSLQLTGMGLAYAFLYDKDDYGYNNIISFTLRI